MLWSVFLLSLALISHAGWSEEPDLDRVMQSYVTALGGEEKVRQIRTLKKIGIYVYNGLEHPLVAWHQADRVRLDIDGFELYGRFTTPGKIVTRAYDGNLAWGCCRWSGRTFSHPPQGGQPEPYPEEWADTIINEAYLISPLIDPHPQGRRITLVGREELEGQSVYHLRVNFTDGKAQDWYLDAQTFLPIKRSVAEEDRFKPRAWFFSDYRPVDGVLLPHTVEIEEGLFTQVHIFDEIQSNLPVDETFFSMPKR